MNRNEMADALRHRWNDMSGAIGLSANGIFDEVIIRYSESHRRHHSIPHLYYTVEGVVSGAKVERDADVVVGVAAAFKHDVVYDPRASDNEEQSAEFAISRFRQAGAPMSWASAVADGVMATKTHEPADRTQAVLLDADLSILHQRRDVYANYVRNVRAEFDFVPQDAWLAGRAAVLESLLDKSRIYHSGDTARREARARANMAWERRGLELGIDLRWD